MFKTAQSLIAFLLSLSLLTSCTPISADHFALAGAEPPGLPAPSGLPKPVQPPALAIAQPVVAPAGSEPVSTIAPTPVPIIIAPTPLPPPPLPSPTPETITGPVSVALDPALPAELSSPLRDVLARTSTLDTQSGAQPLSVVDALDQAGSRIRLTGLAQPGFDLWERYYAVVVPFNTIQDDISLADLQQRWQSGGNLVTTSDVTMLSVVLGQGSAATVDPADLLGVLSADRNVVGVVPFDQLDPTLKVLTVDGANVLYNWLQPGQYSLGAAVKVDGVGASLLAPLLRGAIQPVTNRDRSHLTALMMTGVTAMARATAAVMERKGYDYPAQIIGPTLAQADITHISNEIPFLDDCVVNNTENNLTLCSKPEYWAALAASGADIIGLSGNHVNDFGRDGARRSLTWYKENNISIYGSGFTPDEACAPLLWVDHGNRFAFIAALAFGPENAWVTDSDPGACYYYQYKDRLIAEIQQMAQQVDVVAIELQFEETYNPWPIPSQIAEFRELRAAGAQIVTGVQSHVPQSLEPYSAQEAGGKGMIVYGLGNLYFDQMWSWDTRSELYIRHTIYNGKLISTEILTGVLEDYAQPRWATPQERALILGTIFDAAPAKP